MSNDLITNSSNNEKKFIRRKNVKQEVFNTIERDGKIYIDSREVAKELNLEHSSVLQTLNKHKEYIKNNISSLTSEMLMGKHGGVPIKFYLLDELQATFLCTLSRNTEKVMDVKLKISKTFVDARKLRDEIERKLPTTYLEALKELVVEVEKNEILIEENRQQQLLLIEQQPKIELYNEFINGEGYWNMNSVAKLLGTGGKRLFKFLREEKVLITNGPNHNLPYQNYIDKNYFITRETKAGKGFKLQTLVNARGIEFIRNEMKKKEDAKYLNSQINDLIK